MNKLNLDGYTISSISSSMIDKFDESIFFLGNGRVGSRGYLPFENEMRNIDCGLFMQGMYAEIKNGITDIVNLPTPIYQQIYVDGTKAVLSSDIKKILLMDKGILSYEFSMIDNNKTIDIKYERFFSHINTALILQRTIVTCKEKVEITIETGIFTGSVNCPVPDDQVKDNLETISLTKLTNNEIVNDGFKCSFKLIGCNLTMTQKMLFNSKEFTFESYDVEDSCVVNKYITTIDNSSATLDSCDIIKTSRDVDNRIIDIEKFDYDYLKNQENEFWKNKWNICDIKYFEDNEKQCALRFNIFQLINNCNSNDPTVSIGARGLTHSRYKGCYFWDTDLFMFPFFLDTDLNAARSLCDYRVNCLEAAKTHSKKMTTKGARYPWMAALDGSEQCETWDIGCSEIHVTADVVYALNKYYEKTKDEDYYLNKLAEVYIETARFWMSRYSYNPKEKEYNLLFVKGPDEYCGVSSNNLFTNIMAKHNLKLAIEASEKIKASNPELYSRLNITNDEVNSWVELVNSIKTPRDPYTGRITTDDNFHLLEEVDINKIKKSLKASYHDVSFDRLQRYKVVKQADVLLLMTRFPELFTDQEKLDAWNDFEPICLHDSTLSFASHALFAAQNKIVDKANDYLEKALFIDLKNVMENTGKEGLHLASMGETINAVKALIANRNFN